MRRGAIHNAANLAFIDVRRAQMTMCLYASSMNAHEEFVLLSAVKIAVFYTYVLEELGLLSVWLGSWLLLDLVSLHYWMQVWVKRPGYDW